MASGKEIRSKIASVKNTQKITRAMEMVAASKMRKAQDRMRASRPYADKIRNVIRHLAQAHQEYQHPYLTSREAKKVGFIIVSSDRGLCGGLNTNLFRTLLRTMREWEEKGVPVELCIIGQKANAFFRRFGGSIAAQATHLGDSPHVEDLIGTVKVMLDNYQEGNIDRLYLAFNEFVNTMTQRPEIEQLLPIDASVGKTDEKLEHRWDYLYEPEAKEVLDQVLIRYIESLVYQGVVENIACEQAARMVAMKAASDNAGGFIDDLQLAYNKARQAAITQELSEIVGGAAAL
ncbi:F0F1 ATP synthase subunit gamma [Nitrosococcus watsonii]|uniref:ATP synthase gamma chain n=1 Tax=Nitrosococcus watsoni (strain C-113) TaxID=105559 RepID=D8K4P5_NITWC|nr:F0F1 ATP synthase subunit gamma [Nitrosococcus watsonii]ADJ29847.1 ATP synthase F1, gamma subunit [Nitrosococcus watsonii C-113]